MPEKPRPPGEMKYNDFFRRLRDFDVVEDPKRGKGSERCLVRPNEPGTLKGPFYTLRCHGGGDTLRPGTMAACLRRLQIEPKEFWS